MTTEKDLKEVDEFFKVSRSYHQLLSRENNVLTIVSFVLAVLDFMGNQDKDNSKVSPSCPVKLHPLSRSRKLITSFLL